MDKLDKFTRQYIETALWSTTDNSNEQGGEPLDANYSINDIYEETLQLMIKDCQDFQEKYADLINQAYMNDQFSDDVGHDFWLTRNYHGAGFWDGDYPKDLGEALTKISHEFGEVDLYLGDDGKIYS
jgi:hypothetical protein